MIFRAGPDAKIPRATAPARKQALRALVRSGVLVGLLAYSDGLPVAWCSVAPRPTPCGR
mgnify:CR=1 FL=1|jgi:hypothetical protein